MLQQGEGAKCEAECDLNKSFNEYDSFRFRSSVVSWSSTWPEATRENHRARRSWTCPPPVLWRAGVERCGTRNARFCGCQACAARARQNGLSGPSGTFLAVSRCSSLGRFAAHVGFWPPGRVGFLPLPVGGDCCRGGVRARAPGGAHLATFAGAIFWLERWSGSQSACAVAGAGARARPGGGLPTLSEPVAEPCGLKRRHSAPIEIGRLQRSHRVSWPTRWRGAPRTRAPVPLASTGCARGPTGGLLALSEPVAEPSGLGVPPQCAQVRCGAAFVRSTFLVGTLERL